MDRHQLTLNQSKLPVPGAIAAGEVAERGAPTRFRALRRTLLLFLPIALLIGTGIFVIHQTELRRQYVVYAEQGHEAVLTWTVTINNALQSVSRDLLYLADHYENQELDETPTQAQLAGLARDWISFSQIKQVYDQIRWIDGNGRERLRIRYARPGQATVAPVDGEETRSCFANANRLDAGQIHIEPLGPGNVQGQPAKAYKTRICFGTPLFDRGGRRRGAVLLTYSAADLLGRLGPMAAGEGKKSWLLNRDGYWLRGADPADEWGFMPESDSRRMGQRYPDAWQRILESRSGQFVTPEGLWTFDTVFPMLEGEKAAAARFDQPVVSRNGVGTETSPYLWKTVSLLPVPHYRSAMLPFDIKLGVSALLLLALFFILSWQMARAQLDEAAVRRNLENMIEKRNRDLAESHRLEKALYESELFARATIDALSAEICVLDQDGTIVAVNQAWKTFYDQNSPNLRDYPNYGVGINYLDLCDRARGRFSEEAAPMAAGIRAVISGERDSFALEYPCPSPTEQRWFRVGVSRFQGVSHQVVLTHENITERKKSETELRLSATVYKAIGEAILVTDANSIIVAINPAFTELTGYTEMEVLGRSTKMLTCERNGKNFYRNMWHALEKTGHWQGKIWSRHKDGEEHLDWLRINTIYDEHGAVQQFIGMYSRITDQKLAEQALWEQANFDTLTGLPNRSMFHDRLEQEIKKAHRARLPLALMFLDLDHFKDVNDTLGHDMGDLLLTQAAQHLRHCVRETDTVARLGGDEFTVILGALDDTGKVERVAQSILQKLAQPFELGLETVYISASIGITLYPDDATDISALLKNADQAMYAAKNSGRNQFHYFTPSMQESAHRRMRLAGDLRGALAANQFQVVYQPIVDLSTGFIRKAEALLRWQHPQRGLVSPAEFIPIAEETGLINDIGEWVFREAAMQAAHWRSVYHQQFQVSVNMSPVQFRKASVSRDSAVDGIQQKTLQQHGGEIVVEITEGLLLDASTAVTDQLLLFRDAGIQVSLDDFGTGYSSLSYLKKFHIDYLKIDQSFVLKLEPDSDDMALCEAIVVMAHKLGLKVIAEGIETHRQRQLLAAAGCDFGQGYLFSKPLPAQEFEWLLNTGFAI